MKNIDTQHTNLPKMTCDLARYSAVAGIKETDNLLAKDRPSDVFRFHNDAFSLVGCKRNNRKHLNMEIFGNLQLNETEAEENCQINSREVWFQCVQRLTLNDENASLIL